MRGPLASWTTTLLLTASAAAAAAGPPLQHLSSMTGLGDVRYHRLESKTLGRGFHILVRLPETYSEDTSKRYPTAYLLDGGITFPLLGAYYRYLSLAGEVPDAILVGISYGTRDWQQGNMRGTDFTAASSEREHYGGAPRFQEVLRTELLPLIERQYRSDPARRVIFGQSLGGQFVLYTALTDPSLFWGHIASNPALHRNLPFFLREIADTAGTGGKLFVSGAEYDDDRFRLPAMRWVEHWSGKAALPWELRTVTLPKHSHFSAAPAAFREGMHWLFGGVEPPGD